MSALHHALSLLIDRRDLSPDETRDAVRAIMDGGCSEAEIAALLTGLRVKGEAVDELVGAAQALAERSTPIATTRRGMLDTCGTGGDQLHTFNISTATALVVAACGVPVPKHGNRSVSSSSGSADVLEALGVNIQLSAEQVGRCLDEVGIAFCFAPLFHGAMKHAAPVRKQLKFRTIFNLVGPLTNPARAEYQLVGASRPDWAEKMGGALARLGRKRAVVVCGADQLDEVSLWGETRVWLVEAGRVTPRTWTAGDFGLPECAAADLRVENAAASAATIRGILEGNAGPARNIVVANTAAALFAAERVPNVREGVAQAALAIDSHAVAGLLERLVKFTQ